MKKLQSLILLGAVMLAMASGAQTNTPATPSISPELKSSFISFEQGVVSNKSLTVCIYPSYAPGLKVNGQSKPWGFGAAALYPIGDHLFTGVRMDYLAGDVFAAQANVGVKFQMQIGGHNATFGALTGALLPVQGLSQDNFKPGAIVGAYADINLLPQNNYRPAIDLSLESERWQVPGSVLDGQFVHHIVADFGWKF